MTLALLWLYLLTNLLRATTVLQLWCSGMKENNRKIDGGRTLGARSGLLRLAAA